jgi:hypothetical protein
LSQEQRRELIADQLEESPGRSNRWVAKQLGVHHSTVGAVRGELESTGQISQLDRILGIDGRVRATSKPIIPRAERAIQSRVTSTTLFYGDCRKKLKEIATASIDAVITDPIYPCVKREYGKISEAEWHELMRTVISECRRVLKPKGSAVFVLGPNSETIGKMRLWLWEFMVWAAKEWNLIQDCYWWAIDVLPLGGTSRKQGLLRPSVKTCVWLGPADCFRNQEAVLWSPSQENSARRRSDTALRVGPSGRTYRTSSLTKAADERGGTTPFNCLPIPVGGLSGAGHHHPAATPYEVAAWWCRYILPQNGVLLDPFAGSGTMLLAGLNNGASSVIGIDKEAKYLKTAKKRIYMG